MANHYSPEVEHDKTFLSGGGDRITCRFLR